MNQFTSCNDSAFILVLGLDMNSNFQLELWGSGYPLHIVIDFKETASPD
jgi:hypothetical protein